MNPTTQHLLAPTRCLLALDRIRSALNDRTDAIDMVETIYRIAWEAIYAPPPAIATAARQGGDAKQAPAESPQSGGSEASASPNPSPPSSPSGISREDEG
jgi:hypothetical protein